MARFDLTGFEWEVIQPLLPSKVRGVKRVVDRHLLAVADRGAMG